MNSSHRQSRRRVRFQLCASSGSVLTGRFDPLENRPTAQGYSPQPDSHQFRHIRFPSRQGDSSLLRITQAPKLAVIAIRLTSARSQFGPKSAHHGVGDVVDRETLASRQEEYKSQKHSYIMQLQSGWYIDATKKGNLARFINHSCKPNCRADPWSVEGTKRIGIFAIGAIQPGEELTFDSTAGAAMFSQQCLCGELNCRGSIGQANPRPTIELGENDKNEDGTER